MNKKNDNLKSLNHNNIFIVPDGYFEKLPIRIVDKTFSLFTLKEQSLNKLPNPFKTPSDYFEKQVFAIMTKTVDLPKLPEVANNNVFNLPDNYFEELQSKIQNRITSKPTFTLEKLIGEYWLALTVSLTTIFVITIFVFSDNKVTTTLDNISKSEMTQFLIEEKLDVHDIVEIAGRIPSLETTTIDIPINKDSRTNTIIKEELVNDLIDEL